MHLMASTKLSTQKPNFENFLRKYLKNSIVKHSIEKSILLNFENLSSAFRPWFSEETDFHF